MSRSALSKRKRPPSGRSSRIGSLVPCGDQALAVAASAAGCFFVADGPFMFNAICLSSSNDCDIRPLIVSMAPCCAFRDHLGKFAHVAESLLKGFLREFGLLGCDLGWGAGFGKRIAGLCRLVNGL